MPGCCLKSIGTRCHNIQILSAMHYYVTNVYFTYRHVQTLSDAYMLSKWRTCKSSLQAEHNLVQSIHKDKSAFARPADFAASPASRCFQVATSAHEDLIPASKHAYADQKRMKHLIIWSEHMLHAALLQSGRTSCTAPKRNIRPGNSTESTSTAFVPEFSIHVVRLTQLAHTVM